MKKLFSFLFILLLVGVPTVALFSGAYLLIRGLTNMEWSKTPPDPKPVAGMGTEALEKLNAGKTLKQARQGFTSQYRPATVRSGRAPETPPPGLEVINYVSPSGGAFAAYASLDPNFKANGVVVWVHDGNSGIGKSEHAMARMTREAGLQFFAPSFRGEHRNPGRAEFLFGEVDDLIGAIEYLKRNPAVNPKKIYLFGENQGATLIMLAMSTGIKTVNTAFAWGGELETINLQFARERAVKGLNEVVEEPKPNGSPLDGQRQMEGWLRSPKGFLHAVERPLYYFSSKNPAQTVETPPSELVIWQEVSPEEREAGRQEHFRLLLSRMKQGIQAKEAIPIVPILKPTE
jgi:hypothetical protein